ncbi:hypothetical protein BKK79_36555 (plasmid) [Cupriavidus sp. USMAA2-4]|nr:hypothetical protein BKK79_36555 [Cupriavidus sp. USMAA2-4]
MKWMQTTIPTAGAMEVASASVALATSEKPAAESSIEALATTVALRVFNRCSGHGNDVLAAIPQDRARPRDGAANPQNNPASQRPARPAADTKGS